MSDPASKSPADSEFRHNFGIWAVLPAWQNLSSMYREAHTAVEARTGMERSHHLTAALYFGAAAVEAFQNEHMRAWLKPTKSPEEIFRTLKFANSKEREKWPVRITGSALNLPSDVSDLIDLCTTFRHDLTHPKGNGRDTYERLFSIDPLLIADAFATYIVCFHEAAKTRYPYWVFGWNYLNPRSSTYEIILVNEQQFCHSLRALGVRIPSASWTETESWMNAQFGTLAGYRSVRLLLASVHSCEPKVARFPHQPKLCRRWWTEEHQSSCGNVSAEAIARAIHIDEAYASRHAVRDSVVDDADRPVWERLKRRAKTWVARSRAMKQTKKSPR